MKKLLVFIGLKSAEVMGLCLIFSFSYVIGKVFWDQNDFWLNGLYGMLFICGGILLFICGAINWDLAEKLLKRKKH